MINKPAQDVTFPENSFDMVFTSPPYFQSEVYSKKKKNVDNSKNLE